MEKLKLLGTNIKNWTKERKIVGQVAETAVLVTASMFIKYFVEKQINKLKDKDLQNKLDEYEEP